MLLKVHHYVQNLSRSTNVNEIYGGIISTISTKIKIPSLKFYLVRCCCCSPLGIVCWGVTFWPDMIPANITVDNNQ